MTQINRLKPEPSAATTGHVNNRRMQSYGESVYKKSIEILVNKIFSLIQREATESNATSQGTDLFLTGTVLGTTTEVVKFNKHREPEETQTYFRARWSTKLYSLNMRGKDKTIEFFLVPSGLTMALSKAENDYPPMATLQLRYENECMMWRMQDDIPQVDNLEALSMWAFDQLINTTKGAMQD